MTDTNERTRCWYCNQHGTIGRYNGWHNYETWAVNVWLTNEPDAYERLMSIVQNPDTLGKQSTALKEWIRHDQGDMADNAEPGVAGMYVDLLASAFDMVDWKEIIQNKQEGGA